METKDFNPELIRQKKAIEKFVSIFKGTYERLSPTDVDFKILDANGEPIAYVDVVTTMKNMSRAYPLKVTAQEMTKLLRKRLNPTIVWACDDGIIYGKLKELLGQIQYVSSFDELIVFFDKQKSFKYVRYT